MTDTLADLTAQALDDRLKPFEDELEALRRRQRGRAEAAASVLARYDAELIALGGDKNPDAKRLAALRAELAALAEQG